MSQILYIFRKDIRHLWLNIAIVLMLVVSHAFFEVRRVPFELPETSRVNTIAGLLTVLLPLSIWLFVAMLVFQETLPGDRQFWLTRPYHWPKLMASKILSILVVVNLPLLLSDCYILAAQSFSVVTVIPELLIRQLHVSILFILPALAIAALTSGLAQFLIAWFILLLGFILQSILLPFVTESQAVGFSIGSGKGAAGALAAITLSIILWQYATRRTMIARLVSFALVVAMFPIFAGISFLTGVLSGKQAPAVRPNESTVRISYDLTRRPHKEAFQSESEPAGFVVAHVPLRVEGLPPKTLLRATGRVTINRDDHYVLMSSIEIAGDGYWQNLPLRADDVDRFKHQPVTLRTSFEVELVNNEPFSTVPLRQSSFFVQGLGRCQVFEVGQKIDMTWRVGLTPIDEIAVSVDTQKEVVSGDVGNSSILPATDSVPWLLSPVTDVGTSTFSRMPPDPTVSFTRRTRILAFDQSMELHDIQIADYTTP